jgi:hypothetical protein
MCLAVVVATRFGATRFGVARKEQTVLTTYGAYSRFAYNIGGEALGRLGVLTQAWCGVQLRHFLCSPWGGRTRSV